MTTPKTWEEEFDERFPSPDGHDFIGDERITDLKAFIRTALDAHEAAVLARVREEVEKLRLPPFPGDGQRERDMKKIRNDGLDAVLALLARKEI